MSSLSSLLGSGLMYAGFTFSLGSVEMSSKYSVENFSKDAATLQAAANALFTYFIIAIIWTVASCLVLYGEYGLKGIIWGAFTNIVFIAWIMISYWMTFKKVSKANGLPMPKFSGLTYNPSPIARKVINP